jgi:2-octaprenyl-6-methoxyphenol hydroxylase
LREGECAIAGAGFVGMALAVGLSRLGVSTVLLDTRDPDRRPAPARASDPRGLALSLASKRILDGLGLWQELAAQVTPIRQVHVSDRGCFGATRLDARELGLEALGYVCPAAGLGQALARALAQCGVARARDVEIIALEREPQALALRCRQSSQRVTGEDSLSPPTGSGQGEGLPAGGDELTVRAKLIVAADGSNSRLRALLGIDTKTHDYGRSAIVAKVAVERPREGCAFERFTPQGPVALLPMRGGRYVSVLTAGNDEVGTIVSLSDADYAAYLHDRFGDRMGRFMDPGQRESYALKLTRASRVTANRAVVVGNAAHSVHPNAAQGLNLGLRDAAGLIEHIAEARRTAPVPDIGAAAVLDGYAAQRAPDHRQVVRFTDLLARVFATDFPPVVAARNLALVSIDTLPPLKSAFVRMASGLSRRQASLVRGIGLGADG